MMKNRFRMMSFCCDDTAEPQKCFQGASSESEERVAATAEHGGEGGGVCLQSVVNCLLGGWCDIKLAARLAASSNRAGSMASGDALMWFRPDLASHNSQLVSVEDATIVTVCPSASHLFCNHTEKSFPTNLRSDLFGMLCSRCSVGKMLC